VQITCQRIEARRLVEIRVEDDGPGIDASQTEKIFDFRKDEEGVEFSQPQVKGDIMILQVRPCDARALAFLDSVFIDCRGYTDPMYKKRRDSAIVVIHDCNNPERNCFCTSVGGSPNSSEGGDIFGF